MKRWRGLGVRTSRFWLWEEAVAYKRSKKGLPGKLVRILWWRQDVHSNLYTYSWEFRLSAAALYGTEKSARRSRRPHQVDAPRSLLPKQSLAKYLTRTKLLLAVLCEWQRNSYRPCLIPFYLEGKWRALVCLREVSAFVNISVGSWASDCLKGACMILVKAAILIKDGASHGPEHLQIDTWTPAVWWFSQRNHGSSGWRGCSNASSPTTRTGLSNGQVE